MGWRERDYARFTPEELADYLGTSRAQSTAFPASTPAPPTRHRSVFRGGVGPAVIASATLYVLGHFPAGHPVVPVLNFGFPTTPQASPVMPPPALPTQPTVQAPQPQPVPPAPGTIRGPSSARVGGYLTLNGTLTPGTAGTVSVDGSYDGTVWFALATVPSRTDTYTARIPLDRVGLLHLRVTRPDGSTSFGTVAVTP